MATTLTPPEPPASDERAPRMLTIAVNLLPPEIIESRRARTARRIVLSALVAFTVLLAGWYGLASFQTAEARDELSLVQRDVQRLSQQQRNFADLVKVQAESRTVGAQLSALLAGDLRWSALLADLREQAPRGVDLASVAGTFSGNGPTTAPRPLNAAAEKLVGTVTVTGTADSKASVAAYLDALAKVPGLANPFVDRVTQQDTRYEFTIRVDITRSFPLNGRYPAGTDTGGK